MYRYILLFVLVNDLHRELDRYGKIQDVWIARNPPGFAFVEYSDSRDARDAVREMDGRTIMSNRIRCEISRRPGARSGPMGAAGRGDTRDRGRDDYRDRDRERSRDRGGRDDDRRGGRDYDGGRNGRDRDDDRRDFGRDRDRRDFGRDRDRDFGRDRDSGRDFGRDRDYGRDSGRNRDNGRREPRERPVRTPLVRTEHRVQLSELPRSMQSSWHALKDFLREIAEPQFVDVTRNGEGAAEFATSAEADLVVARLAEMPTEDGTIIVARRAEAANGGGRREDRRKERDHSASRSRSRDREEGETSRRGGRGRERDRSRSREGDVSEQAAGTSEMDAAPTNASNQEPTQVHDTGSSVMDAVHVEPQVQERSAGEQADEQEQVDYSPEVEAPEGKGEAEEVQVEEEAGQENAGEEEGEEQETPTKAGRGRAAAVRKAPARKKKA